MRGFRGLNTIPINKTVPSAIISGETKANTFKNIIAIDLTV